MPSLSFFSPASLPTQALPCLGAQLRPPQTPNIPSQSSPLQLPAPTLSPAWSFLSNSPSLPLSLTSFHLLHSLTLDFKASPYLSLPEMCCPYWGLLHTLLSGPIPSAIKPQHSSTARPGQLEPHFVRVALRWERSVWCTVGPRLPLARGPCLTPSAPPESGLRRFLGGWFGLAAAAAVLLCHARRRRQRRPELEGEEGRNLILW